MYSRNQIPVAFFLYTLQRRKGKYYLLHHRFRFQLIFYHLGQLSYNEPLGRLLLGVPNVGPKTALGVLSALSVEDLARAVERSDHVRLGKVPGIGKKTAERLVLELKEKLRGLESATPAASAETLGNEAARLLSALVNMGYRPGEAERAVSALGPKLDTEPLGNLLREALANLTP